MNNMWRTALLVVCVAAVVTAEISPRPGVVRRRKQGFGEGNGNGNGNIGLKVRRRRPPNGFRTPTPEGLQSLSLPGNTTVDRDSRFLSLFTVVQFQNEGCAAASGDNGTCLTTAECAQRGGVASGPCASNYGVCCVFLATCGQTTRENCTYFVNNGFPSHYDGTGSCQLTIHKAHPNVCQYRLDFDQFNIGGPEQINNMCNNDQFIVSGGSQVPAICGLNTGNHMYIDAGVGITSPVILTIVTSGPSFNRNWKIKICQITCDTTDKAEEGCLQYFTGVSGQIKSFNYDPVAGLQLSNQDYSICVRTERNFCGIQYTSCNNAANNRSTFTLSGNTAGGGQISSQIGTNGANPCNTDWLLIPCAQNVGRVNTQNNGQSQCVDRICGGTFSGEVSTIPSSLFTPKYQSVSVQVISKQTPLVDIHQGKGMVRPFRMFFHTNRVEDFDDDYGNRGFCLDYLQIPCTKLPSQTY